MRSSHRSTSSAHLWCHTQSRSWSIWSRRRLRNAAKTVGSRCLPPPSPPPPLLPKKRRRSAEGGSWSTSFESTHSAYRAAGNKRCASIFGTRELRRCEAKGMAPSRSTSCHTPTVGRPCASAAGCDFTSRLSLSTKSCDRRSTKAKRQPSSSAVIPLTAVAAGCMSSSYPSKMAVSTTVLQLLALPRRTAAS
eukprot:4028206-Prymnesium_polylepis.1